MRNIIRNLIAALFIAVASPAFAQCLSGYDQIQIPICQQTTVAPGFYVATNGNDGNAGTLAAPFATLTRAQTAMRVGGAAKITYVRAGSYTPSAASSNCNSDAVTCILDLTSADNGTTWQYYPPDGYGSASFDGGATTVNGGNGMFYMVALNTAANITVNGLTLHNFQYAAFRATSGNANITIKNSTLYNQMITTNNSAPGVISCYGCSNLTVSHNYIHDAGAWGVNVAGANGVPNNMIVDGNFFQSICTGRPDCAAIYLVDATAQSATGAQWTNNYIRDGNTGATLGSGYGSAMYTDDCASGVTISGNVVTGRNGSNTINLFHGGRNIHVNGNLVDLSTLGQNATSFQFGGCPNNTMDGNQFEHNILISGNDGGGYNILSGPIATNPVITGNAYKNYAGSAISSGGSYSDANPTSVDPQLNCWTYNVAPGSPVFSTPVSFPGLTAGWGPPGFVVPKTGTVPSSPHAC